MKDQMVDGFARWAGESVSRRGSLLTLGGAALAASLTGAVAADAKQGGKKRKTKKNKAKQRCQQQVSQCRAGLEDVCAIVYGEDAAECVAAFDQCCEFLGACDTAAGAACIVGVLEELLVS